MSDTNKYGHINGFTLAKQQCQVVAAVCWWPQQHCSYPQPGNAMHNIPTAPLLQCSLKALDPNLTIVVHLIVSHGKHCWQSLHYRWNLGLILRSHLLTIVKCRCLPCVVYLCLCALGIARFCIVLLNVKFCHVWTMKLCWELIGCRLPTLLSISLHCNHWLWQRSGHSCA